MLNLMLCGCQGKMGRVIEECTLTRGDCRIAAGIDLNTEEKRDFPVYASPADCKEAMDAIIDFSHPNSLNGLLAYAKTHKTPLVIATTGYSKEQIDQIHEAAREIPLFFTFNMSLGVNLLADLARRATAVLGDQFDIEIIEKHHNRKVDAPSGTALCWPTPSTRLWATRTSTSTTATPSEKSGTKTRSASPPSGAALSSANMRSSLPAGTRSLP